ncbi:hypothetical protein [Emcibacter sp. SYSU 3D8]|uniref:hypothetical protein n=1 Tax=Emcibacter sp. SYSU 3D8 TaxID=3133969 RepID=UPI0031FE4586
MKRLLVCLILAVSTLATTPAAAKTKKTIEAEDAKREERSARQKVIIEEEAGKLAPLTVDLSEFSTFEVVPLTYSDAVAKEEKKVKAAKGLESQLRTVLGATFSEWTANAPANGRKLVVAPYVVSLKIVGGGTRFFVGGLAGDSEITMDIQLVDGDTGALIGSPTIAKSSSALAGAWSFGASDNNLDMYIAEIANQYLVNNYHVETAAPATAPAKLIALPDEPVGQEAAPADLSPPTEALISDEAYQPGDDALPSDAIPGEEAGPAVPQERAIPEPAVDSE